MNEILNHNVLGELTDREVLKESATTEVNTEFESRFKTFEGTVADKIFVLLQMMAEYAEVIPDTNQPVDNSKRFHVEVVAKLLKQAEQDQEKINKLTEVTV